MALGNGPVSQSPSFQPGAQYGILPPAPVPYSYEDGPDGVILSGTGAPPAPAVTAGWLLASAFCWWRGPRFRARLLYELSLGNYNRRFAPVKTSSDWLSRDEAAVRAFEEDEKCSFVFTAGAYRDFFRTILLTQRQERAGRIPVKIPVLFLSGTMDPVGERTKGVRRVFRWYDKAGAKDLTLGFYKGARHEVLNEINRGEVYEDALEWLKNHM